MKLPLPRIGGALVLAGLLALGGCSWFKSSDTAGNLEGFDTPAQVLATEGEQSYQDGKYDEAAEMFQQLKDRYPYSRYALLADLRVADAYLRSERYDEAALAYEDFINLHPKNEGVPYALYQMGMVYHDQMLTPDRDPTVAKKASEVFERLIKSYPNSEWAVKAKPRLAESLARQAEHDLGVGKFYYNTDKYRAAAFRFKKVLTDYPDVGLYDEAMEYLRKTEAEIANLPKDEVDQAEAVDRRDIERPLPGSTYDGPVTGRD
ncbi:MAG: outer membrane protein assembly factor BamD [Deltaproteobacteria bacterium]|nr:outer membrane protein assembly factor BamD [Deltaproteobacteria bacterium]